MEKHLVVAFFLLLYVLQRYYGIEFIYYDISSLANNYLFGWKNKS